MATQEQVTSHNLSFLIDIILDVLLLMSDIKLSNLNTLELKIWKIGKLIFSFFVHCFDIRF